MSRRDVQIRSNLHWESAACRRELNSGMPIRHLEALLKGRQIFIVISVELNAFVSNSMFFFLKFLYFLTIPLNLVVFSVQFIVVL